MFWKTFWALNTWLLPMNACRCRDNAKQCTNTRRFVCRGIFGLFSSCFSSAFRQIVAVVHVQIHDFDMNMNIESCLKLSLALALSRFCRSPSTVTTPTYWSARPLSSVLATIQSAAQKCRWRMPQTVAERQMFEGSARSNLDVGRIACHRHEPHIRSCDILRQRPLEVGRV